MTTINFTFTLTPSTPADVTNFNIAVVGSAATLSWDPVLGDPDLSHYIIKFSSDLVTPQWNTSSVLVSSVPAKPSSAIVVSLLGSYLIKAVDIQGYESTNAAIISSTIANLDAINVVSTHNEVGYLGTKVNCYMVDGALFSRGNPARAWDTLADVGVMAYGGSNNLLGITDKDPLQTVSSGVVTLAAMSGWKTFRAPVGITRGKWYWEVYCSASDVTANYAAYQMVGVSEVGSTSGYPTSGPSHMYYGLTGLTYGNGSSAQALIGGVSRAWDVLNTGPYVLGIAFNADLGLVEYYLNNEYQGAIPVNLPKNTLVFPTVSQYTGWTGITQSTQVNFGDTPYTFAPPAGYLNLANGVVPSAYYYFKGIQDVAVTTDKSSEIALSDTGLTLQTSNINWQSARANVGVSKGKWYWEALVQDPAVTTMPAMVGISSLTDSLTDYVGSSLTSWGLSGYNGFIQNNLTIIKTTGTFGSNTDNKVLGIALDMDLGLLYYYKNGSHLATVPITGTTMYPMVSIASSGDTSQSDSVIHLNFGNKGFAFNPPEGFEPLMFPTVDLGVNTTSRTISDNRYTPTNLLNMAIGWPTMASVGEFSGTAAADATAVIEVSTSLDSINWATWAPLVAASFTTRYYKFRAKLLSIHSIDTPLLTLTSATVDMPDITQAGNDIVSSSTTNTICSYSFHEVPAITIAGQNLATGDYFSISSKTTSGFTVNFYNASGTRISRVFDWVAKGY